MRAARRALDVLGGAQARGPGRETRVRTDLAHERELRRGRRGQARDELARELGELAVVLAQRRGRGRRRRGRERRRRWRQAAGYRRDSTAMALVAAVTVVGELVDATLAVKCVLAAL